MSNANGWQTPENAGDLDVTNPPGKWTGITATMDAQLIEEIARLRTELMSLHADHDMLTQKYERVVAECTGAEDLIEELLPLADLGRAVEAMPAGTTLRHTMIEKPGHEWWYVPDPHPRGYIGATAREALAKAAKP